MTKREKFLKEGINEKELFSGIANAFFGECSECDIARLENFFNEKVIILSEDERIILKNIDKEWNIRIKRNKSGDILFGNHDSWYYCEIFNHLFKFIENGEEYSIEELLGEEK